MSALKLRNLTAASNKMLSSLIQLPTNDSVEKLKDDIENLRRRTHIMSMLYDRYIVAIAGLQGVGKSTMISNLYGYNSENTPFLQNQGQGEILPILVTETDNPGKYFIYKAVEEDGVISICKEEISSKSDFQNKSHQYDKNDLLLEITVPFKVFNCSDKSFLLLPGFQSETDYLKELTYSALRASSNCLVLFYQTKYAHKNNKDLVETLKEEFSDASPLFLITWSDKEDSNCELMKRVQEDFGIKEDDRVIRTGDPGPANWKDDIIKAINKYSNPKISMLEIQQKNIKNLARDYNRFISSVKVELRKLSIDYENREYEQVTKILKEIRKESTAIKESLKEELKYTFKSYFHRVKELISKELEKQNKGYNYFKNGIVDFFTNNVTLRQEFKEFVKECLKKSNENNIKGETQIVFNRVANKFWKKHNIIMNLPVEENKKYSTELLLCGEGIGSEPIDQESRNDIFAIMNPDEKELQFSKNLQQSVRLLPLLALEMLRTNFIIANSSSEDFPLNAIKDQQSIIKMYQENKSEVAIGIGLLGGLDIAEGGGIDLFGLLQHNAVNGGAAMVTASINYVLAGIAGGAMLIYMIDQLQKNLDEKEFTAKFAVDKMEDFTIEDILFKYERYIQQYEDIIRGLLVRRFGLEYEYAHTVNCYSSLQNLENINREVERETRVE